MRTKIGWYGVGLGVGLVLLVLGQMPSPQVRVVACDVGQGDAILIIKGSKQVLVDGGPNQAKILACLEKYIPFYDRTIELIVLSNTDYDHLAGLIGVIERYKVIQFVTADGVHSGSALDKLGERLDEAKVPVTMVEQGDKLRITGESELELQVLWPPEVKREYGAVFGNQISREEREQILGASAKRGNLNERSVVLLLLEDGYRALLMGDAGFQAEKELLAKGMVEDVDYLKVGHHGSKYASSLEFLRQIKPEWAVISVGKNNYGHPTTETLERLLNVGAAIYRTDNEGNIVWEER